ncbi:MAG: hypothetical protein IH586_02675 [Anaerolineaceae bacterium]|nr:hypothetical protein [Anaerolineaceae bacterium]
MNPYEPDMLSPVPKTLASCRLPYSLTWEDLQPILPGFNQQHTSQAQAFSSHEKQGLHGGDNSCILTLRYPSGKNSFQSKVVFIKFQSDPQKEEAQKYRFLSSQGVPTPHLLVALRKEKAEVIILEFLAQIGIDFHSASEVDSLLKLLAQVNALPQLVGLFPQIPGMAQADFDVLVHRALSELSHAQTQPKIDAPSWFETYQAAQTAAQTMPLAVNHNEFYFQQTGWAQRGAGRKLVIFDLETMSLRPRFTDIANILYPLAKYSGRAQAALFKVYLDALLQSKNIIVDFDAALRELRLLRVVEICYSLPWLVDAAKQPESIDLQESLSMAVSCLRDDLSALGF